MWSIDQLLSFPALTREPITGTLYWEARQRRIERKINMETFCEQREKMLNKILGALCCQFLQYLWVNNSVFKTVIRRWWWHCIRFLFILISALMASLLNRMDESWWSQVGIWLQFVGEDCYCFYYHIIRHLIMELKYAGPVASTSNWLGFITKERKNPSNLLV